MAIKSRRELEHERTTDEDRAFEKQAFLEAINSLPAFSYQQKALFRTDPDLKGSYFADLQDEEKQDLFEAKLGSDYLRSFASNQKVHMLRNEAVHALKKRGHVAPKSASQGRPLMVTNAKAFTPEGAMKDKVLTPAGAAYEDRLVQLDEKRKERTIEPDAFGVRTHSLGDKVTRTLYFGGTKDQFSPDAFMEFEYDGMKMGTVNQAVGYEQAKQANDMNRALAISASPMNALEYRRGFGSEYEYTDINQENEWMDMRESVYMQVLQAKFNSIPELRTALEQTDGYRLAYTVDDPDLGIGNTVTNAVFEQKEAVENEGEMIVEEEHRDSNNKYGTWLTQLRRSYVEPEVDVSNTPSANPFGSRGGRAPEPQERSYAQDAPPVTGEYGMASTPSSNPFGAVPSSYEDLRTLRFDEPDAVDDGFHFGGYDSRYDVTPEAPVVPEPVVAKEPEPVRKASPFVVPEERVPAEKAVLKPLEMSIHAGPNMSEKAMLRATEATRQFAEEAEAKGQPAVVYVAEHAHKNLKKAVFFHNDRVEMKPLDMGNMPQRSLIVQHESVLSGKFKDEIIAATHNSAQRDIRALTPDPTELPAYALNDYLVNQSKKVTATFQADGVEKEVLKQPASAVPSPDAKTALRMNAQHTRQAQSAARQKERQPAADIKKGSYAANPFSLG